LDKYPIVQSLVEVVSEPQPSNVTTEIKKVVLLDAHIIKVSFVQVKLAKNQLASQFVEMG